LEGLEPGSPVLSTGNSDWDNVVRRAEGHDVFHTSRYMSLFEHHFGNPGCLFVYEEGEGFVAYPFFLRDLSRLPFYGETGPDKAAFDIVSPWYYGGILVHAADAGERAGLLGGFHRSFDAFSRDRHIISEFGRLHPFLGSPEHLSPSYQVRTSGLVVYIDLGQDVELMWEDMTRSNRKRIRRCQEAGVLVSRDSSRDAIDGFTELYLGLMDRKGAGGFYRFPRGFFDDLLSSFPGDSRLLVARYRDTVIAGLLLLGGGGFAHTYLSASDPEYLRLGPNNLLKWEGALAAREMGYRYYLLGGGTDSLLAFKQTFSRTAKDFTVYCRVRDEAGYERLSLLRSRYAASRGEAGPEGFFFPEYRRGIP
jgi:hypothetical protein